MKKIKIPLICLALAAISITACTNNKQETVTSNNNKLVDTLTLDEAWLYVHNFNKFANLIDSATKEPNTRAIWFSKERLEAILKRLNDDDGDGVRFYYATYSKFGDREVQKTLAHNTLVISSTYLDGTIHRDSYWKKGGRNGAKGFLIGAPPENRGEMCPPPKACDSVGAMLLVENPKILHDN